MGKSGISVQSVKLIAESIGLCAMSFRANIKDLAAIIPLPVIILWKNNHFIVVYKINSDYVYVCDPAIGYIQYTYKEFQIGWYAENKNMGVLLAFESISE